MQCKWHKCNRTFEPEHHRQVYCCKKCSTARFQWRLARGSALVDMLLNNETAKLVAARDKIKAEIERDTPK